MKKTAIRTMLCILTLVPASVIVIAQSNEELQMKIGKINKELAKALMDGNMEKSLGYYAADAISMPNNAPMVTGMDAIKKSNQQMMQSGMKFVSCDFKTVKIIPDKNFITEIGTYSMQITMPNMNDPMQDNGKYVNIWEKQPDGSLKIKVEIWNTDTMPMLED
jgi:ketosteroid isomerase-like protein